MTTKGGCLCGGVRYEVHANFTEAYCCHCSRCRKFSGSAFAANAPVSVNDLKITQGKDLLRSYEIEGSGAKTFCSVCGSSLFGFWDDGEHVSIRMGTLDADYGLAPHYHIFVDSKASWYEITDALPQWPEMPE